MLFPLIYINMHNYLIIQKLSLPDTLQKLIPWIIDRNFASCHFSSFLFSLRSIFYVFQMTFKWIFKNKSSRTMVTWKVFLVMLWMLAINVNMHSTDDPCTVFTIRTFLVFFLSMNLKDMAFQTCFWSSWKFSSYDILGIKFWVICIFKSLTLINL